MDLSTFSPSVRTLLSERRLPELGPGRPTAAMRPILECMTVETLFVAQTIRRPELAQCCMAALWLHHDFLDESHAISQDIECVEGSYWHGILHRREPDYGNAAYWFRRVRGHPVFEPLHQRAAEMAKDVATQGGGEFLARQTAWDPFAFIDLCQEVACGHAKCETLCRNVQLAEWKLLFTYCYEQALAVA